MPTIPRDDSYALYNDFDSFSYKCIKYLMENDEVIWKLLDDNTPSAWNGTDLTSAEKAALIYDGSDDTSGFKVFLDQGQPDVQTGEVCILRVLPYSLNASNRVVGDMLMMFECYSHYKINHLDNYKTRTDMIIQRLLQVFNGATVGGIGKLHLDSMGTFGTRSELGGQLPFRGRWLLLGNKLT